MSYAEDLSEAAKFIASVRTEHLSSQAMLRLAIHASYQALLHCLQRMCADEFVGNELDEDVPTKAWHEVYRALRHDVIRRSCQDRDIEHFPKEFRELAQGIYSLQQARFSADYDSRVLVNVVQVDGLVTLARDCIKIIGDANRKNRVAFATWIMFDKTGGVKDARNRARSKDPTALVPVRK